MHLRLDWWARIALSNPDLTVSCIVSGRDEKLEMRGEWKMVIIWKYEWWEFEFYVSG